MRILPSDPFEVDDEVVVELGLIQPPPKVGLERPDSRLRELGDDRVGPLRFGYVDERLALPERERLEHE